VRTQKPQITPQNARTPFVYRRLERFEYYTNTIRQFFR